jgi:hypothetical protein
MIEPPPLDYRAPVVLDPVPGIGLERSAGRCLWAGLALSLGAILLCLGSRAGSMRPVFAMGLLWLAWLTCLVALALSIGAMGASGFRRGWKPLVRLVGVVIVSIVAALCCVGTAVATNSP